MGRMALLLLLAAAACGGPEIPQHNGYKSEKSQPWKKARTLKLDDQNQAKAKGDLSYPERRRAVWYQLELAQQSDIDLMVEINGPGDAVNDSFDLGVELLDPGFRKLVRKDLDEGDQQQEEKKTLSAKNLPPGMYYVHMYLQGRMDTADYILHVTVHAAPPTVGKSDFPALVAFPGPLPMVPITDDTPKGYKPPSTTPVVVTKTTHHPTKREPPPPPPPTTMSARIIGLSVVSGGTQITIGRGTASSPPAQAGMKGKVNGVSTGGFTLAACNERTCTATVAATPDQIKNAGTVTLGQ